MFGAIGRKILKEAANKVIENNVTDPDTAKTLKRVVNVALKAYAVGHLLISDPSGVLSDLLDHDLASAASDLLDYEMTPVENAIDAFRGLDPDPASTMDSPL